MPTRRAAPPKVPPPEEIAEIARESVAHRHTVERRLLRLPVRGAVSERVDAELTRRGYITKSDDDGDV